jgi:hypothetical protein
MEVDSYGFHIPVWPTACPPRNAQTDVLSVAVGNTHLMWTMHASYDEDFIPATFWKYVFFLLSFFFFKRVAYFSYFLFLPLR